MFRENYDENFMLKVYLFSLCYRIENEQFSFERNYVAEDTHTIRNITSIILKPFFGNNKKVTFEGYMLIINGAVLYLYCIQALSFCFHAQGE